MIAASYAIKVVYLYDHTRIASYRHWGARSAGLLRVLLLALDGRSAKLARGLPSGHIMSALSQTQLYSIEHNVTRLKESIPKSDPVLYKKYFQHSVLDPILL